MDIAYLRMKYYFTEHINYFVVIEGELHTHFRELQTPSTNI